jgi:hypothetical protein
MQLLCKEYLRMARSDSNPGTNHTTDATAQREVPQYGKARIDPGTNIKHCARFYMYMYVRREKGPGPCRSEVSTYGCM